MPRNNLNGQSLGDPDMSRKTPYHGNARFIELGSADAPFRSLLNVDQIINVRFEQKVGEKEATYDDDGLMTAPPEQWLEGYVVIIEHTKAGQNIFFPEEQQCINCYNAILDMILGTGVPIVRMPKLRAMPVPSAIVGADGEAINDELPGEVPDLTDEELEQLAHPEIDVDAIADAIEEGVEKPDGKAN